ncbi:hypothetical protein Q644_14735 [Brucella intermedia 229E]|uniref:Uncharacterized protein n=1 Tax=Brucella intermedia 229E TaxID=1337887 RepID=U4V9W1_9HYPH|nr:hypothetical protein Q644_14735 [Brucella intermedia 229E]
MASTFSRSLSSQRTRDQSAAPPANGFAIGLRLFLGYARINEGAHDTACDAAGCRAANKPDQRSGEPATCHDRADAGNGKKAKPGQQSGTAACDRAETGPPGFDARHGAPVPPFRGIACISTIGIIRNQADIVRRDPPRFLKGTNGVHCFVIIVEQTCDISHFHLL